MALAKIGENSKNEVGRRVRTKEKVVSVSFSSNKSV
jgi:hypothetical protein